MLDAHRDVKQSSGNGLWMRAPRRPAKRLIQSRGHVCTADFGNMLLLPGRIVRGGLGAIPALGAPSFRIRNFVTPVLIQDFEIALAFPMRARAIQVTLLVERQIDPHIDWLRQPSNLSYKLLKHSMSPCATPTSQREPVYCVARSSVHAAIHFQFR